MTKIIHINRNTIDGNRKHSKCEPPIIVRTKSKRLFLATTVEIKGPSKIIYNTDNPLDCGARVWIETNSEVVKLT